MDNGDGTLKELTEEQAAEIVKKDPEAEAKIIRKGEVLEIKGSSWRFISIGKREMRLRLLPRLKE